MFSCVDQSSPHISINYRVYRHIIWLIFIHQEYFRGRADFILIKDTWKNTFSVTIVGVKYGSPLNRKSCWRVYDAHVLAPFERKFPFLCPTPILESRNTFYRLPICSRLCSEYCSCLAVAVQQYILCVNKIDAPMTFFALQNRIESRKKLTQVTSTRALRRDEVEAQKNNGFITIQFPLSVIYSSLFPSCR